MRKFLAILLCCAAVCCPMWSCKDKSGQSHTESSVQLECKRVGQPKYGYIDIPVYWKGYVDEAVSDADVIQFSDANGTNIITMKYYTDTDAQTLTLNMWGMLESSVNELTSAIVEIDGIKTYQLYGTVPEIGKIMAMWILDGSDGLTHCITIEGTQREVFDLADTFNTDK